MKERKGILRNRRKMQPISAPFEWGEGGSNKEQKFVMIFTVLVTPDCVRDFSQHEQVKNFSCNVLLPVIIHFKIIH